MGLVNPHGIGIPRQLCFISNPTSFQLFEAVNCEKKKKNGAPGNYCFGRVLGMTSAQPQGEEERN